MITLTLPTLHIRNATSIDFSVAASVAADFVRDFPDRKSNHPVVYTNPEKAGGLAFVVWWTKARAVTVYVQGREL